MAGARFGSEADGCMSAIGNEGSVQDRASGRSSVALFWSAAGASDRVASRDTLSLAGSPFSLRWRQRCRQLLSNRWARAPWGAAQACVSQNVLLLISMPLCCTAFHCSGEAARTPQAFDEALKLRFSCRDC